MKAMLLLSGGIDSLALAYWSRPTHALTVNYGQKPAAKEREVSAYIAKQLGISHQTLDVDIRHLGGGSLAGVESPHIAPTPEWWPFRNQFLITLAGMAAVRAEVGTILIGTVSSDSQHADGSAAFISAMQTLLSSQEGNLVLSAPGIAHTSEQLVRKSEIPREWLAAAHSCHVSDFACSRCRGCQKHEEVFTRLGLV